MTRESRDPLSVLRQTDAALGCAGLPPYNILRTELHEAIAQVEALVLVARIVKAANDRCPAAPLVSAFEAENEGLDWSPEMNATLSACDALDDALQPFTPTDSEGGGNGR